MTTSVTIRTRTLRRCVLPAAAAAAALALAACGGDTELTEGDSPEEVAVDGAAGGDDTGARPGDGDTTPPAGGGLTAEDAEEIALAAAPEGSRLDDDDTEQDTEAGQPVWEVEIDYPDGEEWDYYVHRETGEIVATELDDDPDDDGTDPDDDLADDDDR